MNYFASSLTGLTYNGEYFNGTSASSPIFTGLTSLYQSKYGDYDNDLFREHIELNCLDSGSTREEIIDGFAYAPTMEFQNLCQKIGISVEK